MKRILNSDEQTAYCWVRIIRSKVNDIIRNPKYYGENSRRFSEIFREFTEENWRSLYLYLVSKIKGDYEINGTFSQSTAKKGHLFINDVLSIPDINLSERQKKPFSIDMFSKNVYISNNTRKRLPSGYDDSHNYVLNGNEEELEFYNLVYNVISSIRIKDKRIKSLNQIRRIFCEKYCEVNNIPFKKGNGNYAKEYREVLTKFDSVIRTFKAYSIIKVEPRGKRNVIREWPIIKEDCIENMYSDLVIDEFNKLEAKKVKAYVPPKTREERRMFNGYARYKKAKLIKELMFAETITNGRNLHLSLKANEIDGTIELHNEYPDQFSQGMYNVSYNVLLPNDFSVVVPMRVYFKGNYITNYNFMLKDGIVTIGFENIEIQNNLRNNAKVAIIEEEYGNIIVRYEAEIFEDHLSYTNVSIRINNDGKKDIKYNFTVDDFKNVWSYIKQENSNYTVSPKTVKTPVADILPKTSSVDDVVTPDKVIAHISDNVSFVDVDIVSHIPAGYKVLYGLYSGNFRIACDINRTLSKQSNSKIYFRKIKWLDAYTNKILAQLANEIALPSLVKRIDKYIELSENVVSKKGKCYRKVV